MKPASAATAAPVSTVGGGGGGVGTGVGTGAGAGAGFGVGAGSGAVSAAASGSNAHRSGRALIPVQRLDLEPIYSQLKNAIGSHWAEYKDATTQFLLGLLNQNEFSSRADHIICADPKTEHLHNRFICALIGNLSRDLPDPGVVASWVSTNDKPAAVAKPVSGDVAEQRLKTEVMHLPPRDRRRIKAMPERGPSITLTSEIELYHRAKQIKLPSQVPASAGGLNKTNWELEVRKRYAQPLASETGEFPDTESIHARMVPICYEESIVSGAGLPCAEFMKIATETYVKSVLSTVFSRTRSNGPSGTTNCTMTRKYRQQLEHEELAFTRGEITKDPATGLLPVEAKEASSRKPLSLRDLRLALELGGGLLSHMPLLVNEIMGGCTLDNEFEAVTENQEEEKHVLSLEGKSTLSKRDIQRQCEDGQEAYNEGHNDSQVDDDGDDDNNNNNNHHDNNNNDNESENEIDNYDDDDDDAAAAAAAAAHGRQHKLAQNTTGKDVKFVVAFAEEMDVDDTDLSDWEGGTMADRTQLGALLDECLSMSF